MNRQEIHTRIHYYSTMLLAFSLPIAKMMQLFIIFLVLNWIIEGDFKKKFKTIAGNKFALLFILFYFLHMVGLAYTQNIDSGLFDIQMKLTLLLFPLIFCSKPLNKKELGNVFYAFIAGGIVSSLLLLGISTFTFFTTGENHFFYETFSIWIHPSYLSMYLNFAIAWIILNVFKTGDSEWNISKWWSYLIIAFFSVIIVLLSSKLGLITMVMIYTGFLIYGVFSRKKYLAGIAGLFVIVISIYSVLHFVPEISGRIERAISAVTESNPDQTNGESTAVRMLIWKASNIVIKDNFLFGTGTGDAKDELMKEYNIEGMTGALTHNLNCHNEFYQVFVTLGLLGFIILILHLFWPMVEAKRRNNIIFIVFLLIIIVNFLTESMLETQAGVMFFALFNSLLCFSNNQQPTTNN